MPYVKTEVRVELEEEIEALAEKISRLYKHEGRDRAGMVNYTITTLLLQVYPNESYGVYNEIIGALECCKLEMYRRAVAPYENQKIHENNDVFPNPVQV